MDGRKTQVVGVDERAELVMAKETHVKDVMEDRNVSVRGNRVAEDCSRHPSIDGLGQECKLTHWAACFKLSLEFHGTLHHQQNWRGCARTHRGRDSDIQSSGHCAGQPPSEYGLLWGLIAVADNPASVLSGRTHSQ